MNNKVPIESVFDIYNDDQMWNPIVGFKGYEVSNKGFVRSLKFFNDYPYGILLSPCNKNNDYILSDNHNVRRKVNIDDIYKMRDTGITTFTCTRCNGFFNARNQRHFLNPETVYYEAYLEKVERVPRPLNKDQLYIPHFTIIDDKNPEHRIIQPLIFHNCNLEL